MSSSNSKKYIINNNKNSSKSSIQNYERPKIKKININKFLTRTLCFEQKKNFNLEQKRFQKLLKEQNDLMKKPYLTGRTIGKSRISKKDLYFKKAMESIDIKKKKVLDAKRNNTIEGTKLNNSTKGEIKYKYNKNDLNMIKTNKYSSNQKVYEKKKGKENMKEKNYKHINIQKNNHINKKAKYNHDEILYDLYKQNELMDFKKTYLKNKYSYEFKPILNYNNKYRNISSKYDKINNNNKIIKYNCYSSRSNKKLNIANNIIINKSNNNLYNSRRSSNNNINNINNLNRKKINNKRIIKKKKKLNKSEEIKHSTTLFNIINNKENKDNKDIDNTYYINVNESLPWNENMTNNILYKNSLKDILYKFVEIK